MLPEAHVVHSIENRLRIKIPSRKGDVQYFSLLQDGLQRFQGIERLESNPVTASMLLIHRMDAEAFAEYARANQLFDLRSLSPRSEPLFEKVVKSFQTVNQDVKSLTANEIDIPSITFLGLVGVGLFQISRGNFMAPAWYTAFWYASGIVLSAHMGREGKGG